MTKKGMPGGMVKVLLVLNNLLQAGLEGNKWEVSRFPSFAIVLNKAMELIDLSPSIPNPETYLAEKMLELFGGKLIDTTESAENLVVERVY